MIDAHSKVTQYQAVYLTPVEIVEATDRATAARRRWLEACPFAAAHSALGNLQQSLYDAWGVTAAESACQAAERHRGRQSQKDGAGMEQIAFSQHLPEVVTAFGTSIAALHPPRSASPMMVTAPPPAIAVACLGAESTNKRGAKVVVDVSPAAVKMDEQMETVIAQLHRDGNLTRWILECDAAHCHATAKRTSDTAPMTPPADDVSSFDATCRRTGRPFLVVVTDMEIKFKGQVVAQMDGAIVDVASMTVLSLIEVKWHPPDVSYAAKQCFRMLLALRAAECAGLAAYLDSANAPEGREGPRAALPLVPSSVFSVRCKGARWDALFSRSFVPFDFRRLLVNASAAILPSSPKALGAVRNFVLRWLYVTRGHVQPTAAALSHPASHAGERSAYIPVASKLTHVVLQGVAVAVAAVVIPQQLQAFRDGAARLLPSLGTAGYSEVVWAAASRKFTKSWEHGSSPEGFPFPIGLPSPVELWMVLQQCGATHTIVLCGATHGE